MSLSTEIQRLHDAKDAIRSAIVRKGVQVSSLAKLDDYAGYVDQIRAGALAIPLNVDTMTLADDGTIATLVLKDTITTMPEYEFASNSSMTSVSMSSVTTVSRSAFYNCSSLVNLSIPNVVTIDYNAFSSCASLPSVELPSTITTIYGGAFNRCTSLTTVTCYATTPPAMNGYQHFDNCPLEAIYVPAESVSTYKKATRWSSYSSIIQAIPS